LPSEGKGHTFESCRVRHFIASPGTDVQKLSRATLERDDHGDVR